jgi:transcriptional regulator with XRE-family HTH domain
MEKQKPDTTKKVRYDLGMAYRFSEFRKKHIDKSQVVASKRLKCSQATLSYIERGMMPITSAQLKLMEKEFSLNPKWILSGEKPMLKDGKQKTNTILDVKYLDDRIDTLTGELKVLAANLTQAWKTIEIQGKEIDRLVEEMLKK